MGFPIHKVTDVNHLLLRQNMKRRHDYLKCTLRSKYDNISALVNRIHSPHTSFNVHAHPLLITNWSTTIIICCGVERRVEIELCDPLTVDILKYVSLFRIPKIIDAIRLVNWQQIDHQLSVSWIRTVIVQYRIHLSLQRENVSINWPPLSGELSSWGQSKSICADITYIPSAANQSM